MADNPTSKFKFISPGVFVDEIDNSQLPATPAEVGPMVIGRARKGPAMEPVTVSSFSEFIDVFGEPIPGGEADDASRFGNTMGPTYAPYAAQAWLRNNNTLTFMRTVGVQDPNVTTGGEAGYKAGTLDTTVANGGAFGLFLWPSSSTHRAGGNGSAVTGALAAIFYCTAGRVYMSGTRADGVVTGSACELYETEDNGDISLFISKDGVKATEENVVVSLQRDKNNFIRKVLNTNPTVTNTAITRRSTATSSQGGAYWLGESFETALATRGQTSIGELVPSGSAANANVTEQKAFAAILPLRNQETTSEDGNDFNYGAQKSTTGFYFAQELAHATVNNSGTFDATNRPKLFRFESLTPGEWVQRTIKISIERIKAKRGDFEQYGTFSVVIRQITDSDEKPQVLERYDNLDLNPASPNYIAARIGDRFMEYDTTEKRNREYGQYRNKSKYIRVVMDDDVEAGVANPELLPFGVFGPLTYRSVSIISGSAGLLSVTGTARAGEKEAAPLARGAVASMVDGGPAGQFGFIGSYSSSAGDDASPGVLGGMGFGASELGTGFTGSIVFPSVPLRKQGTWGSPKNLEYTYWGAWTGRNTSDTTFNAGIYDMLRPRVNGLQSSPAGTHDLKESPNQDGAATDPLVIAWHFSIDDISGSAAEGFEFVSGSGRAAGGDQSLTRLNSSYSAALDAGLDRFTTLLHGGFDGFNVTEKDPFRNSAFSTATNEKASYQLHTLRRAINIVSDTEDSQYNLITMPGIIQNNVTDHLISVTEDRSDSMAIIDIDNVYTPNTENTQSVTANNAATVTQIVDTLKDRNINNSYAATYAPWVLIRDSIANRTLWAPPSVAALGVLSNTDRVQGPWFAPAGFTRGGLTEGAAGITILDVSRKYTQDQRDDLYDANVNPIAKFPAEGIVVFGQKTLQQTRSALDRINVRRLMIYLKREISFIASRLLFDPNTLITWNSFRSQAEAVLKDVQARFGIEEFRLVLDETTTTPDLVDQNIIYAKLLVKPTRAVEFFAIDFVVESSGASFDD